MHLSLYTCLTHVVTCKYLVCIHAGIHMALMWQQERAKGQKKDKMMQTPPANVTTTVLKAFVLEGLKV